MCVGWCTCTFVCLFYSLLTLIEFVPFDLDASDDIPGIGQYEDFHTIDWQREIARDRMRHRHLVKKRQDSWWDLIKVSQSVS